MNIRIVFSFATLAAACQQPTDPSRLEGLGPSCPVGTTVDASSQARTSCDGRTGVEIKTESGGVQAMCVVGSSYSYKCVVTTGWCKNGAKKLTRDELTCADDPSTKATVQINDHGINSTGAGSVNEVVNH